MQTFITLIEDVLGLQEEKPADAAGMINIIIDSYIKAKESKDYDRVDEIRAGLKSHGVVLKDSKESVSWAYEEI
jgi:cysteinyl-tRNA synthetase